MSNQINDMEIHTEKMVVGSKYNSALNSKNPIRSPNNSDHSCDPGGFRVNPPV